MRCLREKLRQIKHFRSGWLGYRFLKALAAFEDPFHCPIKEAG
jgi:hypothetical protein